jgi:hypothetical protein
LSGEGSGIISAWFQAHAYDAINGTTVIEVLFIAACLGGISALWFPMAGWRCKRRYNIVYRTLAGVLIHKQQMIAKMV